VQWGFVNLENSFFPLSFVACELGLGDLTVKGAGEALFYASAQVTSFAEAWERVWMKSVFLSGVLPIDSSNGFAAGTDPSDAVRRATRELIERQILLVAWREKRGFVRYLNRDWIARLAHLRVFALGWECETYLVRSRQFGEILFSVAVHQKFGAVADSVYFTGRRIEERKLAFSIARAIDSQMQVKIPSHWEFPVTGSPRDHAYYYRDSRKSVAFEFLKHCSPAEIELPGTLNAIESRVLCEDPQWPAVAVVWHQDWDRFAWGSQAIQGENIFPHPLA